MKSVPPAWAGGSSTHLGRSTLWSTCSRRWYWHHLRRPELASNICA